MAPQDVTENNAAQVWQTLYGQRFGKKKKTSAPQLKVGNHVRLSKRVRTFKKGYLPAMYGRSVCDVVRGARTRDHLPRERDGRHAVVRDVLRPRFAKSYRGPEDDVACGQCIKTQIG